MTSIALVLSAGAARIRRSLVETFSLLCYAGGRLRSGKSHRSRSLRLEENISGPGGQFGQPNPGQLLLDGLGGVGTDCFQLAVQQVVRSSMKEVCPRMGPSTASRISSMVIWAGSLASR